MTSLELTLAGLGMMALGGILTGATYLLAPHLGGIYVVFGGLILVGAINLLRGLFHLAGDAATAHSAPGSANAYQYLEAPVRVPPRQQLADPVSALPFDAVGVIAPTSPLGGSIILFDGRTTAIRGMGELPRDYLVALDSGGHVRWVNPQARATVLGRTDSLS